VALERDREAVHRRPGEVGGVDEVGQRERPGLERVEHDGRLVEHAHAAYTVHVARLLSQDVR
jgi:hypothetical protein